MGCSHPIHMAPGNKTRCMAGRHSHWLLNTTAADKSWRKWLHPSPELNWLCSSVRQEEEQFWGIQHIFIICCQNIQPSQLKCAATERTAGTISAFLLSMGVDSVTINQTWNYYWPARSWTDHASWRRSGTWREWAASWPWPSATSVELQAPGSSPTLPPHQGNRVSTETDKTLSDWQHKSWFSCSLLHTSTVVWIAQILIVPHH